MVNITKKSSTLRIAIASAVISVSKSETIEAVLKRRVPKGDVFEFARAAGLLGVKKTSDLIPDCHPLPLEFSAINYAVDNLDITVTVEVHTVYKTGVEVEAMHGASVAALTIYDMLKPIDKDIEIHQIRLIEKKGGKSDFNHLRFPSLRAAVVVCSDSVFANREIDKSGTKIVSMLTELGLLNVSYEVLPDERNLISSSAEALSSKGNDLIIITGGAGLSKRDVTPEAIAPLLDRRIDGVMEAARRYGQERMPYAMLSRGICGFIGNTLVITFPGSESGAQEYMDALFPQILHLFKIQASEKH